MQALFEEASETFDEKLTRLEYAVPRGFGLAIATHVRVGRGGRRFATALDAGCGTGRMGSYLRPLVSGTLSGSDLSPKMLAIAAELRVRTMTEVVSVQAEGVKGGPPLFSVGISAASSPSEPGSRRAGPAGATETLAARYVVWAAGEFQYPAKAASSGAVLGTELCMHNSRVQSWASLPGDDFVVIGGYVISARPLSPTKGRSHNSSPPPKIDPLRSPMAHPAKSPNTFTHTLRSPRP